MNEELKILIKAEVDNALKNIKNVSKELKNIQTQGTKSGKSLGDSLKAISKKAAIVLASIVAVVAAVIKLGEKSLEHSKNIAKLNSNILIITTNVNKLNSLVKKIHKENFNFLLVQLWGVSKCCIQKYKG